jgi:hypothetical protein
LLPFGLPGLSFINQQEVKIMVRRKRTSQVLESAHQRLAGLHSITPPPDFGPNMKLDGYSTQIDNFSTKLNSYNQMIATLDELQNQIDADEASLRETNKRMLSAVEAHYGPDSSQYEQAGGIRQRDRKHPIRKPSTKPAS